jgi:hypothetical protein
MALRAATGTETKERFEAAVAFEADRTRDNTGGVGHRVPRLAELSDRYRVGDVDRLPAIAETPHVDLKTFVVRGQQTRHLCHPLDDHPILHAIRLTVLERDSSTPRIGDGKADPFIVGDTRNRFRNDFRNRRQRL